ncbi:acetyltransferase [Paractinoplanes lichenicola]|uniref:Acetyltransferase n=1 Tax=Paractinoplanes lichenicola TaxID=2802976 RepID=A0ABS1VT82_9ACTN|nr:acetyltransferase [Actinoplanes lichenicola]MBL7257664.1 acetyltransferase [Actinoplanes lichenicola]
MIYRQLLPGEEAVFDALGPVTPISYADGLAGGGFHPSRTWVAQRDGQVVARAAWVLPPGAAGDPWLEVFDLVDSPAVGASLLAAAHAALGGAHPFHVTLPADERVLEAARLAGLAPAVERRRFRWSGAPVESPALPVRPSTGPGEVRDLVSRIARPDVLTGSETALTVAGLDLARDPLPWVTGPAAAWHVLADGTGVAGTAGEACWPMLVYLGVRPEAAPGARSSLLAASLGALIAGGAEEVVADVESTLTDAMTDLDRAGFRQIRARMTLQPPRQAATSARLRSIER